MASRKPPLAEVRATVKTVRRSRSTYETNGELQSRPGPYVMSWVIDPEDVAVTDAFMNGPMAGHPIVLRLLTLEQGWTAPKCDPNVSPEEAVLDDELAALRAQHAEILAAMSDEPAPDSASA